MKSQRQEFGMDLWYSFIEEYKEQIPFKSLSVILEAFYWWLQWYSADDALYKTQTKEKVYNLIIK